jgi:hypothetical protein
MAIGALSTGIDLNARLAREPRDEFTSDYRDQLERELEGELERRSASDAIADVVDLSGAPSRQGAIAEADETSAFGSTLSSVGTSYSRPPEARVRHQFVGAGSSLEERANSQADPRADRAAMTRPDYSAAIAAYATGSLPPEPTGRQLRVRA